MDKITFDFEKITGPVKPMHGVNNGPIISYYDYSLFHYLQEAGIPFCRLHDFGGVFGGTHFVDVENIFTNMDADENDPASYDFALTDLLMENLDKIGVKPFYRLGATIENGHRIKAYHIYPPKDNHKWARICANIIRHYNEGWADGYHYGIEYWEIWNEPDNEEEIADNPMWKGTKEQFFEHYKVVSNHLKKEFPNIKVGGYASCGFYATDENAQRVVAANSSPRMEYFIEFFQEFMKYITTPGNESPLDFFSWHTYASIRDNIRHARYARQELDRYGFTATESILNEWNPEFFERTQAFHAAKIAGMMLAMHHQSVDQMEFYTGDLNSYGSLFHPMDHSVTREYYTFVAFNRLYQLGNAVSTVTDGAELYALAATGGTQQAAMIVNATRENRAVSVEGIPARMVKLQWIDEDRMWEEECRELNGTLLLPAAAVVVLSWNE